MGCEIVLRPDQLAIAVRDIPALIAHALHPQPAEGRTQDYLDVLTEAEQEHRSALMANVRYGNLLVLSAKTNQPTDENNPVAIVKLDAFIKYVAQFNVSVRIAAPDAP